MQVGEAIIPVCTRCAGIYTAIFAVQMFYLIANSKYNYDYPDLTTKVITAFLMVPLLVDWIGVRFEWFAVDHTRRYFTGVMFGFVIGTYFLLYSNRIRRSKAPETKRLSLLELIIGLVLTLLTAQILRWLGNAELIALILLTSFITFWVRVNYIFLRRFITLLQILKGYQILAVGIILFLSETVLLRYFRDILR